jgi:nucleoside-diphosphate-sugar epimerase
MRVLILSGTGFIGSAVIHALAGHEVIVFHRGHSGANLRGVQHIHGDRADLALHAPAFRSIRPDVVVDMAAQNAGDARQTIDCLRGVASRAVVISSVSVYRAFGRMIGTETGDIDNAPSTELSPLRVKLFPYRGPQPRRPDDPRRWLDDYDKIPAERAYLAAPGLTASIVRLPMVYGPGDPDRRIAGYVERLRQGQAIRLTNTAAAWRNARAHVANAAHAIALVTLRGAGGEVYNVAEPEDFSEHDWIEHIDKEASRLGAVQIVPDEASDGRPAIDEFPPNTNFAQHLVMDCRKIRRELDYTEVVEPAKAIAATVRCIIRRQE